MLVEEMVTTLGNLLEILPAKFYLFPKHQILLDGRLAKFLDALNHSSSQQRSIA
jgi:hypothetical protein